MGVRYESRSFFTATGRNRHGAKIGRCKPVSASVRLFWDCQYDRTKVSVANAVAIYFSFMNLWLG